MDATRCDWYRASGGFRGGSRSSLEPPSGAKLFRFHGEFKEILSELRLTNPPFLHLNTLLKNPGSVSRRDRQLRELPFISEDEHLSPT